ncbi:peptidoglycan glycosyltransferase [uncultured Desulfovibrio sp.]|uniref:peptidoglycan glycosyltransferase n=1 Tax=uncultured Desulfovibrio sp. TaxID=167968 RepID=UPI00262CFDCC|nr:peptidoglycan glycosyltransferase [uncultured Desulfovibrio sp.]
MQHLVSLLFLALCLLLPQSGLASPAAAEEEAEPPTLSIRNQTAQELLSVRFSTARQESFARLDLPPAGEDALENPGGRQDIRLDMGFALWTFTGVALDDLTGIATCADHKESCLILLHRNGRTEHRQGTVWNLLPEPGSRPVCALTRFRTGMKMQDACAILEKDAPRDENGAVLTSLGFAGLIWAARLTPGPGKPETASLEHLELRQVLTREYLHALLQTLYTQRYCLWQAEFPGMDVDFTEMAAIDDAQRQRILEQGIDLIFSAGAGEASIMLAPRSQVAALREADAPGEDVQLFTVSLYPASRTLLVDIAAYRADEGGDASRGSGAKKGGKS